MVTYPRLCMGSGSGKIYDPSQSFEPLVSAHGFDVKGQSSLRKLSYDRLSNYSFIPLPPCLTSADVDEGTAEVDSFSLSNSMVR